LEGDHQRHRLTGSDLDLDVAPRRILVNAKKKLNAGPITQESQLDAAQPGHFLTHVGIPLMRALPLVCALNLNARLRSIADMARLFDFGIKDTEK
jgi:hypothetical protein